MEIGSVWIPEIAPMTRRATRSSQRSRIVQEIWRLVETQDECKLDEFWQADVWTRFQANIPLFVVHSAHW